MDGEVRATTNMKRVVSELCRLGNEHNTRKRKTN